MTRTEQLQSILTPYIVSGQISKSVAVNIIALMQLTENEKNDILNTLRLAFRTARWNDYSVGTPYDAALRCLEKYHPEFKK